MIKPKFNTYLDGLMPAVVQDSETLRVLMVGFMNRKAFKRTGKTGLVTLYSKKRKGLWVEGETSGNPLEVVSARLDCDQDTLLIMARPAGPVCHTGADTCFKEKNVKADFLYELERFVAMRVNKPIKTSVTNRLLGRGRSQIAKKFGEEAVELVIEAVKDNENELFKGEASDLLYHLIVMLVERGVTLDEVLHVLKHRRK